MDKKYLTWMIQKQFLVWNHFKDIIYKQKQNQYVLNFGYATSYTGKLC